MCYLLFVIIFVIADVHCETISCDATVRMHNEALLTYSVPLAAVRWRLMLVINTYALHVPSLYMI